MNSTSYFTGPWLPWFHGDFLRSTQGWTVSERGIYFLLLGASWEMGVLPSDHRRLAGIVGAQLDEFDEAWKVVSTKFQPLGHGLVNARLEQHRAVQADRSAKARQSANKRWNNDPDASAYASADAAEHTNADARNDANAMLEPMLEGMLGGCSSDLKSQILESKNSDPKPSRAKARSGIADPPPFHKQVIDAYHEICSELPKVKVWTDARRKALDARIAERVAAGKQADQEPYWRIFLCKSPPAHS